MATQRKIKNSVGTISPIHVWQAALFFTLPGIFAYLGAYVFVPLADRVGIPLIVSWTLFTQLPIFVLASAIIVHYFRQPATTWATFVERFRIRNLTRKEWFVYVPAGFLLVIILNEALSWTVPLLSDIPVFAPPPVVPELFSDPYAAIEQGAAQTFMGVEASGQWWLVVYWIVAWIIGAVWAEEIVWRGYLLPRMELSMGQWAWVVNGLMWNLLYHLYTSYNYLSDMPMMLILPFLAYRLRTTSIAAVLHMIMVALALVILIPGIIS